MCIVHKLEEDTTRLEQYQRKDVMIVTGLEMHRNETQSGLYDLILGMFNNISTSRTKKFTSNDFVAIHRNGNSYKGNRPPLHL